MLRWIGVSLRAQIGRALDPSVLRDPRAILDQDKYGEDAQPTGVPKLFFRLGVDQAGLPQETAPVVCSFDYGQFSLSSL